MGMTTFPWWEVPKPAVRQTIVNRQSPFVRGLVHWALLHERGGNVFDLSGYHGWSTTQNGVWANTPAAGTFVANSESGGPLAWSAPNDPAGLLVGSPECSVLCWFHDTDQVNDKTDLLYGVESGSFDVCMKIKDGGTPAQQGLYYGINTTTGTGGTAEEAFYLYEPDANAYIFMAWTWSGIDGLVDGYKDGEYVGTGASSHTGTIETIATDTVLIGGSAGAATSGTFYQCRMYNRKLTAGEINALYFNPYLGLVQPTFRPLSFSAAAGPITTPQSITGSLTTTPSLATVTTHYRSLSSSISGTSNLSTLTTYARALTSTLAGTPTLSPSAERLQSVTGSATVTPILNVLQVIGKNLLASITGTATLSKINIWVQSLAVASSIVSSLSTTSTHYLSLLATSAGTATLNTLSTFSRTLTQLCTGTGVLATTWTSLKSLSATITGTATLDPTALQLQALSVLETVFPVLTKSYIGTTLLTQSISVGPSVGTLYIEGSGPVLSYRSPWFRRRRKG